MAAPAILRRVSDHPQRILWAYLLLIAVAEVLTAVVNPQIGLIFHAILLIVLTLHGALERNEDVRRMTLALTLAPLIRLLSLSLPLNQFPQAIWHPIVSIPLLLGMWIITRQLGVTGSELGLRRSGWRVQVMLIGGGLTLGAIEYWILKPAGLLQQFNWTSIGLASISLFVFTGFTEEIIFRGLLQSLALPVLGRFALVYVAILFAVLHAGYLSIVDVLFVFTVGIIFAYIVFWSGSILGVTLSHGLTNVTLFLFMPYLAQYGNTPLAVIMRWLIWLGAVLWLIAFAIIMWRAEREGKLLLRDPRTSLASVPSLKDEPVRRVWWRTISPRTAGAFIIGAGLGLSASAGLLVLRNTAPNPPPSLSSETAGVTPTPEVSATATTTAIDTVVPTPSPATSAPVETVQTPTPITAPTPAPAAVVPIASMPWPEQLPSGMNFIAGDSWPFQQLAPDRQGEPFLVFRDGPRWLSIRHQEQHNDEPLPASTEQQQDQYGEAKAMVARYHGGGFTVFRKLDDQFVQISGEGLSDQELEQVVGSLRTLDGPTLRTRLTERATGQNFTVTALWPTYLPAGMALAYDESTAQLTQPGTASAGDAYHVVFRFGDANIQIGGGTAPIPELAGTSEQINDGEVSGNLTTVDRKYLLVINASTSPSLHFAANQSDSPHRLPLVQQGPVWISAENIERAEFDKVVAGLNALSSREFTRRAYGQSDAFSYMWPAKLPEGYALDMKIVEVSWDDFLLQGGLPFFKLTAIGPGNETVTLEGGHQRNRAAFILPEGPGIEQVDATVRGQPASGARSQQGTVLLWAEHNTYYQLTSPTLSVEQLVNIATDIDLIDRPEFYRRIQ